MTISREAVQDIFSSLAKGDANTFFSHVDENVNWTVMGTHPLAGVYTSVTEFQHATFSRLSALMTAPIQLVVQNVFTDGNTAIVELAATSETKTGWKFDNKYCWVCEFANNKILWV